MKKIKTKCSFNRQFISLNPETDSSLDIIKEGLKLGLNIWITNPDNLTFLCWKNFLSI